MDFPLSMKLLLISLVIMLLLVGSGLLVSAPNRCLSLYMKPRTISEESVDQTGCQCTETRGLARFLPTGSIKTDTGQCHFLSSKVLGIKN
ncbi:hypothetical protein DPMN_129766 [Dreissena polymorpha]|uniref:Uncharacterized protein n=1 Tax=Dreissena polymorpha TaxID=45954 RepID=A0A9D4K1A2_DREPO|nr:hypothetical protein DPMN_129766 [Dreissena polymorpha]